MTIGNVCCNSCACADDLTVVSKTENGARESNDFANLECYELETVKSVGLKVTPVNQGLSKQRVKNLYHMF